MRRSTFQNYDIRVTGGPAVEYTLSPYTESTRRQLRLSAALEGEAVAYVDETLFGRTREVTLRPRVGVDAVLAQPWGSANVSTSASTIATRAGKDRLGLYGNLDVRAARGLTVKAHPGP